MGRFFLARNCYFSAHSLLFIYIKAEKIVPISDFQCFFSALRHLFSVIGLIVRHSVLYISAHSLLFIYIKAEKTALTSDFQYFFSAQRYLFLVIGLIMGAFAWQAYQAHHSFLFLNRYSSSCFLISSGISLETGHTTALAKRSVNSERKSMSRSNCSMDITSIRS